MDLASVKKLNSRRARKKRLGCGAGSGHGKTCGRGSNGARSRSGWSSRNMTGGQMPLFRRLPKRGFSNAQFGKEYSVVNVEQLALYDADTDITAVLLHQTGLLKKVGKNGLKVLSRGLIDKPVTVRCNAISKEARRKIEAAGGTVELIPAPKKPKRNKMKSATPKS